MTFAVTGLTLDEVVTPQNDARGIPPKLGIPLSRTTHQPQRNVTRMAARMH
jgi:hypothetical protein